ncbi:MAG: NAD(P)-dependent oxidoreductase [Acidimicrobiia bacterium]|nr:NAD(P)-dependent oxidoreductase [Acidimicrobiia bacterium]
MPSLNRQEIAGHFAEIHPPFTQQAALAEANRCLFCFDAPCTIACPTHIDVPGFIKKISTANLRGSALTILDSNILGLSCSRVCPVEVLCEGSCVLHRYNQRPIEIGRLQRHAMDHFYDTGAKLPVRNRKPRMRSIACVGAGPASLACAAELARRGYSVTVFDSRPYAGGLNTYGVAEYKLRPDDSLKEVELVHSLGVTFELNTEVGVSVPLETLEQVYDLIFLGLGLGPTESLGLKGVGVKGVVDALTLIADYKTAGNIQIGRRVAVIGGGNTAIDAACAAARLGAEEVLILYRRGRDQMPAFEFEFERAQSDGVRFHWLTVARSVKTGGDGRVTALECVRMDLGASDASGRRAPTAIAGSEFLLECDMVIPSIGQTRLVEFLSRCRNVELRDGCVVTDPHTGRTTNPMFYAGGDCVNGGLEVVDAAAGGKRAAIAMAAHLEEQHG